MINFKPVSQAIIIHWNRPGECLKTIHFFLDAGIAVQVLDNASTPDCFAQLNQGLPVGVKVTRLDHNRGWGGGANVLLREWLTSGNSEYCFLSAHDAIPKGACLHQMIAVMDRDKQLGLVCPEYGIPELPHYSPIRGPRLLPCESRKPGTVERVVFAHGTLALFRRACLEKIGLFDERYFAYGDETEIGLRANHQGWGVAVVWGAVVENPGSWTSSPLMGYLWARSSLLMARAYGGWGAALVRTGLMLLNNLAFAFQPSRWQTISSPRARTLAILDFYRRRFGYPPASLMAQRPPKTIS